MDFESVDFYRTNGVSYYWSAGTALAGIVMLISFTYIVAEWCIQSHLSTSSYSSARSGLLLTRRFKRYTSFLHDGPNWVIERVAYTWVTRVSRRGQYIQSGRRSLVWTWKSKDGREVYRGQSSPAIVIQDEVEQEEMSASLLLRQRNHRAEEDSGYALQPLSSPESAYGGRRSPRSSFGEYNEQEIMRPRGFSS